MFPPPFAIGRRRQVVVNSQTISTGYTTPWLLMSGGGTLRLAGYLTNVTTNLRAKVGWRKAVVRTDVLGSGASAWTDSSTVLNNGAGTADIDFCEDFDLSTGTSSMWVQGRLGVYGNAAGLLELYGNINGEMRTKSVLVAARTFNLEPSINTGEVGYLPCCPPHGALGLSAYAFAFIVDGLNGGSFAYGAGARTFKYDNITPNTWESLSTYTSVSAAENRYSGNLSPTVGTNLLIQPGIRFGALTTPVTVRVLVTGIYT